MLNLADEIGHRRSHYWHVMDSGKDSVDLLQQAARPLRHQPALRAGAQPGARQRLLACSSSRASRRARRELRRASRLGAEAARQRDPEDRRRQQQLLGGEERRATRQHRPRPDGPPARQDVAARRLPRDRRRRRSDDQPRARVVPAARALTRATQRASSHVEPTTLRRRLLRTWPRCQLRGAAAARARGHAAALRARRRVGPAARRRRRVLWTRADRRRPARARARCAGRSPTTRPSRASSRAAKRRPKPPGRTACTPSPPASEPARWYWYRFCGARPAAARSAARAPRRPPDAAARRCASRSRAASAGTSATTPAWRHVAADELDLVMFLGDYIYEYAAAADGRCARSRAAMSHDARRSTARATRTYKSDPALQARARGRAVAAGLGRPRGRATTTPACTADARARTSRRSARRLPRLLGAPCRSRRRWRPRRRRHAHRSAASTGAGSRASTLLDDRQYRDPQVVPAAGPRRLSNTRDARAAARRCSIRRARCSAPTQERWLADGWDLRAPLEPASRSRR